MNRNRVTVGIALALVLVVVAAIGRAEEDKQLGWHGTFSGSEVSTEFDTNGDGAPSALNLVAGKSNLGSFTAQAVGEFQNPNAPNPPPSCTLPNGKSGLEFTLLKGSAVIRFDRTGNLLFLEFTSAMACLDPTTGQESFSAAAKIIGGTGKFATVTGSFEDNGTGQVLAFDPAGHFFGSTSGTFTATIIRP